MPIYKFKRKSETTEKEVGAMIDTAEKPWLKALCALLYLFGPRVSEARMVRRRDLWEDSGYLIIKLHILKGRRMDTNVPYDMSAHILQVPMTAPFAPTLWKYAQDINDPDGKLWHYSRQWLWVKLKELNPNISPHLFRHDRLTKLAYRGASPFELQDWAGWSDVRPAAYYVRTTGNLAKNLSDKVE